MSTARTAELTLSSRANAYVALTKPDVSFLVLITTAAGYYMGARGPVDWLHMMHTVFATMLIAAGTAALNHYIERESDRYMRRTASRPLPSGVAATARSADVWRRAVDRRRRGSLLCRRARLPLRSGRRHLSELPAGLHAAEEAHRVGHVCWRISRRDSADDRLGSGHWLARSRRVAALRDSVSSGNFRISTPSPGCTAKTTRARAS